MNARCARYKYNSAHAYVCYFSSNFLISFKKCLLLKFIIVPRHFSYLNLDFIINAKT